MTEDDYRCAQNSILQTGSLFPSLTTRLLCSHWAAVQSLGKWLEDAGIPGITGVDTRQITKHLRSTGCMLGKVMVGGAEPDSIPWDDINARNIVAQVSIPRPVSFNPSGDLDILVVDCGLRHSQLRCLAERGARLRVVPWNHRLEGEHFDGLFISSGPGDPEVLTEVVGQIKKVLDRDDGKPVFGICLGHQLLAHVFGGKTYKMGFGHHGGNQPVIDLTTDKVEITSQNHSYAVDEASLPDSVIVTHKNLNDDTVEGLRHKELPVFSVQYHPEAAPGPHDALYLFKRFVDMLEGTGTRV